jgi:hypothetical protein
MECPPESQAKIVQTLSDTIQKVSPEGYGHESPEDSRNI